MLKTVFTSITFCFLLYKAPAQVNYNNVAFSDIEKIHKNKTISDKQKLSIFYTIKTNCEKQIMTNDSLYVLTLLKIGEYESALNNNNDTAINYANRAIEYNRKVNSKNLTLISNYDLGLFYYNQFSYLKALSYFDNTNLLYKKYKGDTYYDVNARWIKAEIYLETGDYQKTIDESNFGLSVTAHKKDTLGYTYFLNRKAFALLYKNDLSQSLKNAETAIALNKNIDLFELSTSYKIIARAYEANKQFDSALLFYIKSKNNSLRLNNSSLIAGDFIDLGNFYITLKEYSKADQCYFQALHYTSEMQNNKARSLKEAIVFNNLSETAIKQNNLSNTQKYIQLAFLKLGINDINITRAQLSNLNDKRLVTYLLYNTNNYLLHKYLNTKQNAYLKNSLKIALVADSVITQIRHEQLSEESKLYWRDKTRDLYINAIEACYLDNNASRAFYFMERSRAALLNDKLNELNASAYLSPEDAAAQESYKIKIAELEQRLSNATENSNEYKNIQLQLLNTKSDFEHFIKSLEKQYPAYYQYKYEDAVPSLTALQSFLKKNKESFVYYFTGDSSTYILAISGDNTKFIRLTKNDFDSEQLSAFLQLCANKEALNNHYSSFASLSNSIYKKIFEPLQLPKGRVIICADNIIIPFDALCKDESGRTFLLNDYSFSYVYSARYLMKQFNNPPATGSFLGFAPVSFASYLDVRDLKNAAIALHASAAYYNNNKIFTNQNASRSNFFRYVSSYSVVSIFSHARADTTDNEPVLYMHDSLIHLSELQLLNKPATKLILLSACQTNVGKSATGEGIYSLARGFATAGISSVAATLWKADEQTIYIISEKFNKYLSEGMDKDEALQKAKLYFVQKNANSEKLLPYYWANMILIGNTDAILLQPKHHYYYEWVISGIAVLICFGIIFLILKKK
jgi:CHAT domain-containing protein/tetratricopeptide (TPR) repeat protein